MYLCTNGGSQSKKSLEKSTYKIFSSTATKCVYFVASHLWKAYISLLSRCVSGPSTWWWTPTRGSLGRAKTARSCVTTLTSWSKAAWSPVEPWGPVLPTYTSEESFTTSRQICRWISLSLRSMLPFSFYSSFFFFFSDVACMFCLTACFSLLTGGY